MKKVVQNLQRLVRKRSWQDIKLSLTPKLLHIYISRDFIISFCIATVVFTGIMILMKCVDVNRMDGFGTDLNLEMQVVLLLSLLPAILTMTIPMAFMGATVITFSRASSDNEIIALRASGLTVRWLAFPILFLSIVSSAFCLVLNDQGMAWSLSMVSSFSNIDKYESLFEEGKEVYIKGSRGNPGLRMVIGKMDDSGKKSIQIMIEKDNKINSRILANNFLVKILTSDDKKDGWVILELELLNGLRVDESSLSPQPQYFTSYKIERLIWDKALNMINPDQEEFVPMRELNTRINNSWASRVLVKQELKFLINEFESLKQKLSSVKPANEKEKKAIALKIATEEQRIKDQKRAIRKQKESIRGMEITFHQRLAQAMSSIVFVLLGIPLGIAFKGSNRGMGIMLSVVVLCLVYFPLTIAGQGLVRSEILIPLIGQWMPNLVIGGVGLVSLYGRWGN